jgi:predicted enzyme related to lactoylglutathione lyase
MTEDHGRFIWYELMTPDIPAAKRFYTEVVGWTAQDMSMSPDMTYTVLNANGAGVAGAMALTAEHKAQGIPPNWTGYVAVDDCDAAAAKAKSLGGSVMREPSDIPGIGRFAIIADPHGAVIAIMKPVPPPGGRTKAARGTPGHGAWHELYAGDANVDIPFYQSLFGWRETAKHDMGPMGFYHLFGNADGEVGGMMTKPPQVPSPCWTYYFESNDVEAAAQRVKNSGGTVRMGPMDVPGGSRIIQCLDPQGAAFAMVKSNT